MSLRAFLSILLLLIIMIIILFQEDNIFGTNASLTYGPQLQYFDVRKCYLFTVCTEQMRSPYTEHAASGLSNPIRLEGGGV